MVGKATQISRAMAGTLASLSPAMASQGMASQDILPTAIPSTEAL